MNKFDLTFFPYFHINNLKKKICFLLENYRMEEEFQKQEAWNIGY